MRTPANAAAKALEKAGKTIEDVKRVEINEAFSSVALNSTRLLGADEEIVNVNGGAVALGHPIGASGGRIVGDDGARAAPERRRARPRRDLLRRRPGRRAADRGLIRLLLTGVLALAFAADALACSCLPVDLVRDLPRADGAFVGTLLEREDRAATATLLFRVEQVYKGDIENRVEVVTARGSAACGIEAPVGERVGLLLERDGGRLALDALLAGRASRVPRAHRRRGQRVPAP